MLEEDIHYVPVRLVGGDMQRREKRLVLVIQRGTFANQRLGNLFPAE